MSSLITHRFLLASAALLTSSFLAYGYYRPSLFRRSNQDSPPSSFPRSSPIASNLSTPPSRRKTPDTPRTGFYTLTLSTPLHCDGCISSVTLSLQSLPGIHSVSCSLESQLVTVIGSVPPSAVIKQIQNTGRAAVLRGSGTLGDGGAGVCILEVPIDKRERSDRKVGEGGSEESPIRGLIRFVQLQKAENENVEEYVEATGTLLDVTLTGLPQGRYYLTLHTTGDISSPPASLGPPIHSSPTKSSTLGDLSVDKTGHGELVSEIAWPVREMVGHAVNVCRRDHEDAFGTSETALTSVVGVVARSAGVWENEKVVCACSGKTIWEERKEMVSKGIA